MKTITKPVEGYASFYQSYLDLVPNDGKLIQHLKDISIETEKLISELSEEQLIHRYSEGKWTIKDILNHLVDCERVLIYRATTIARGDKTNMPGFDEALFAKNANANNRQALSIMKELEALRVSSILFIENLEEEAMDNTGTANGYPMSTRLLVNHIYGHHRHHLNIIRERYL